MPPDSPILERKRKAMQYMGTLPRNAVIAPIIDIPSGGVGAVDDSCNPRRIFGVVFRLARLIIIISGTWHFGGLAWPDNVAICFNIRDGVCLALANRCLILECGHIHPHSTVGRLAAFLEATNIGDSSQHRIRQLDNVSWPCPAYIMQHQQAAELPHRCFIRDVLELLRRAGAASPLTDSGTPSIVQLRLS